MNYSIVNLLDFANEFGEDIVTDVLSGFSCQLNNEIDDYLKKSALEMARKKISMTFLVFDMDVNLSGYFTLTHKNTSVSAKMLSKSVQKKIIRFSEYDADESVYRVSAFLIAQFGKNKNVPNEISGDELMRLALLVLEKAQKLVGGGLVYLECEDKDKLLDFYQSSENRFVPYGIRKSGDGIVYKQLLRLF